MVRRKLKQNQEQLVGLTESNPQKGIDNPTTERLLKMFDNIPLATVRLPDQIVRHIPDSSTAQVCILELLGLSANIFTGLADN